MMFYFIAGWALAVMALNSILVVCVLVDIRKELERK